MLFSVLELAHDKQIIDVFASLEYLMVNIFVYNLIARDTSVYTGVFFAYCYVYGFRGTIRRVFGAVIFIGYAMWYLFLGVVMATVPFAFSKQWEHAIVAVGMSLIIYGIELLASLMFAFFFLRVKPPPPPAQ